MDTCDFFFTLELSNAEGALERMLGRIRQRGFRIVAISARESTDAQRVRARVIVRGERSLENLLRQLCRSPLVLQASGLPSVEPTNEADDQETGAIQVAALEDEYQQLSLAL